ncbi:hypothetical protein Tco_0675732 [Tanacetum coccineum]
MKIISALEARTLLSHGCEGFLANIHDTTSDVSSIHDQPIVSEFQDVFPEELPGIPPIRDVEFNIELIPGAEPISKAPYRMAPIELKELKDQLQELLERGFIRQVNAIGVHRFCFVKKKELSYDKRNYMPSFPSANFGLKVAFLGSHIFIRKGLPWIRRDLEEGYSRLAIPFTKLMRNVRVCWDDDREKSFEELKQLTPGKANVVADALSRKSGMIAGIKVEEEIIRDLERLDIELCVRGQNWPQINIPEDPAHSIGQLHYLPIRKDFSISRSWRRSSSNNSFDYTNSISNLRPIEIHFSRLDSGKELQNVWGPGSSSVRLFDPRQTDIHERRFIHGDMLRSCALEGQEIGITTSV